MFISNNLLFVLNSLFLECNILSLLWYFSQWLMSILFTANKFWYDRKISKLLKHLDIFNLTVHTHFTKMITSTYSAPKNLRDNSQFFKLLSLTLHWTTSQHWNSSHNFIRCVITIFWNNDNHYVITVSTEMLQTLRDDLWPQKSLGTLVRIGKKKIKFKSVFCGVALIYNNYRKTAWHEMDKLLQNWWFHVLLRLESDLF